MFDALLRFSRVFLASALVTIGTVPGAAADEPPRTPPITPPPPSPSPVPYPDAPQPPPCPFFFCPGKVAPLAHSAGVDDPASLEVAPFPGGGARDRETKRIEVVAWSWGGGRADSITVYSADPQEGGQVAGRKAGHGQDGRAGAAPLSEPLPSGTLTVSITRGSTEKGQHISEVKLTARGRTYRLRDVDVIACAATDDRHDACLLTYSSRGD